MGSIILMHARDETWYSGVSGYAMLGAAGGMARVPRAATIDLVCVLARGAFQRRCLGRTHRPTIDLMVDPVCQVALVLHLRGETPEDLAQEPPNRICNVTDTRMAYVAGQPVSVNGYGVYHPTVDFQVQYAGRGFVLADLYSNHPGMFGIHMPNATVAFLGSACGTAEAVHQVGTGVGKCPYPGMIVCLVSHMQYNTISGAATEKMNSSNDQCRW